MGFKNLRLRNEIAQIHEALEKLPHESEIFTEKQALTQQNKKLQDFIAKQIEAKEKELECPVCIEVASVPIFMCQELHLICCQCRSKVEECPVCRVSFSGKLRRHRFAEQVAEELIKLKTQIE